MPEQFFYLHGFASAPTTTKGRFFAAKFAGLSHHLQIPDLNAGDFSRLTLSRMIQVVRQAISACPPGPIYLLASSMGALVATHFLERYRQAEAASVAKMLFMAPAFDFLSNRQRGLAPEEWEKWQTEGTIEVYHYGYQKRLPLHYGLIEDLRGYDAYAADTYGVPILIFHGQNDETVDPQQSQRFAQGRPNVSLRLVESDHLLHDQLETIWQACLAFFELEGLIRSDRPGRARIF